MKIKQTILTLLLTFIGLSTYADEITVYDGTSLNNHIPFFGVYADYGMRNQFIIPANQLTDMNGCDITKLTFYSNTESQSYDEGVTVYLKEVNYTTFSSATFEEWSSMTTVYTGTISVSNNQMDINLTSPYSYGGGNLMIGFQVTTWGTACTGISWYGVNQESGVNTSAYNKANSSHTWSSDVTLEAFIPKTTLTYELTSTSCPKPSNLTVFVSNSHTATVTWESDFTSFNLRYKVASEENWTVVNNLTTKSYTLSTLSPETNYKVQVQAIGNNETSNWASASFTTLSSIPAPTELACTASSSASATLAWTKNGEETSWQICIDGDETNLITVSENPCTLTTLTAGLTHTAKVRAVNNTGDEWSAWSNVVSFESADKITVFDGTQENFTIPMYVYSHRQNYVRGQYVIPASELTEMVNGTISSITLYTKSYSLPYTTPSTIDVYLKEVNFTTITSSNFVNKADASTVYQGKIEFVKEGTNGFATIVFTKPYQYNGGNLLIGFDNTTKEGGEFIYFYGTETSYNSAAYQYSAEMDGLSSAFVYGKAFIPKTTFSYTAFVGTPKPSNLQVSDITAHSATVTWRNRFTTFNLRYKTSADEEWTEVSNVTNGNLVKSYNLTNLRSGKSYEVQIQAVDYDEMSDWASVSFNTIAMPAPAPVYCSTVSASSATLGWIKKGDESAWQICLDNDESNLINAATNPYTLTGLTTGQTYSAKVRAVNASGDEWSEWSDAVSFTTTDLLTLTPPVIEGYEGVYDGTGYNFRVVSNPDNATLRFGYSVGNCTSTAVEMGYRVNAGTYTYYWQATKEGYNTITGSVQVIIHKAPGTIKYNETKVDKFADDEPFTNPLTFTGDGTLEFSSFNEQFATVDADGQVTIRGIGWTDITAAVTDGQNYTYAVKEAKYGLTMTKKKADSYKPRVIVWLTSGILTDLTFDSEPELVYDESTKLVSVTNTEYAWPLKNMRKLTFTRNLPNFTFNEEDDNSSVVDDKDGYLCDFTLNRTLRAGSYNTFAVPFDVSIAQLTEVLGDGTMAKELKSSVFDNQELSMTFGDAASIVAGTPYLVKVPATIVNPTFKDIVVRNVSNVVTTDFVNFVPAIGKTLVIGPAGRESDRQSVLFVGAANSLYNPTVVNEPDNEESYLKGFRAFFQLHDAATNANSYSISFDNTLTGITPIERPETNAYYTLDGRQLDTTPTKKGIYIQNGRKVIIK